MEPNHPTPSSFFSMDCYRPPYTYKELIIKAFELVKLKPLELRDIYFLIAGIFPYYKPGGAWQSAVRHVLFLDPSFTSDPRTNLWQIVPNFELQTLQYLPSKSSLNANVFEEQYPVSASSLLISLSRNSKNKSLLPCTQNSKVHTVSSYATCQPRMSSFESTNKWIDCYSGTSFQEAPSWPSNTCCMTSMSNNYPAEQSFSRVMHGDFNCLNKHSEPVKPVKPNAIKNYCGSDYQSLSTFSPCPINTSLNIYTRNPSEENLANANTLTNSKEGAFDLYHVQKKLSDCKYSGNKNEITSSNAMRHFSLQHNSDSLSSLDNDNFANPQNLQTNDVSDSVSSHEYCNIPKGTPFIHTSNQLISVSIHAPPSLYQTQNQSGFDPPSVNYSSFQSSGNACRTLVNDSNFTSQVFEASLNTKNSEIPSLHIDNVRTLQGNAKYLCPDNIFNTNVDIGSPTLTSSSVNDVITSLPVLSTSVNKSLNTLEVAAPADQGQKTNWENSLININIHLLALKNTDKLNTTSEPAARKTHQQYDERSGIQSCNTPANISMISDTRSVNKQGPRLDHMTPLFSSVREYSELPNTSIGEYNSVTKLDEPPNLNATINELIAKKSENENSTCSSQAKDCPQDLNIDRTTSEMGPIIESNNEGVDLTKIDCFATESMSTAKTNSSQHCHLVPKYPISTSVATISTLSPSTDTIPVLSTNYYIPITTGMDSMFRPMSTTNSTNTSSSQNTKMIIVSSNSNNVELEENLEIPSLAVAKSYNEIKKCFVLLERIILPSGTINLNSILLKKNKNDDNIEDIISNDENIEDSEDTILPGNSSSADKDKEDIIQSHARRSKSCMPAEVNGYVKPSYNYSRLITQALATAPERKATALQICEAIAKRYPYFAQLTDAKWQSSIYTALRTRKKFFTIVCTNEQNQLIWTFNPTFEQFMLDKWVPKYVKDQSLSSSIQSFIPLLPKSNPIQRNRIEPKIESSANLPAVNTSSATDSTGSPCPVIVFSGSLSPANDSISTPVNCDFPSAIDAPITSDSLDKDPLEPEHSLFEPHPVIESVCSVDDEFRPWEPEVSVQEDTRNSETQPSLLSVALEGSNHHVSQTITRSDFSLRNLDSKHVINKDEIYYRVNFNKEHQGIEKFRLHCTVCDVHLGTSGTVCHTKVRFHCVMGVLVCVCCYEATCTPKSPRCIWCADTDCVRISCVSCSSMFCQKCMDRNFGPEWSAHTIVRKDWNCFLCDTKPIWPHRAIAYFLFRYYRSLKRKKNLVKNRKIPEIFTEDLTTCCKTGTSAATKTTATLSLPSTDIPEASSAPNVVPPVQTLSQSISNSPPMTVVSQPSMFLIREQSPNYIYVQTSSSVPSVTLNTGTQYIHNVYPDRPASSNPIMYSQPSEISVRLPHHQETNRQPSTYSFLHSPHPPYSTIDMETTPDLDLSHQTSSNISSQVTDAYTPSKSVNNFRPVVASSRELNGDEEPILIPDSSHPEELKIHVEKTVAVPIMSARERIEQRPMPKSKKQSLLRTVLMNESIESMKRHLQHRSEPDSTTASNIDFSSSVPSIAINKDNQNIEEPILKSIIESATERLLNLQSSQNVSSSINKNTNDKNRLTTSVDFSSDKPIDLCEIEDTLSPVECKIIQPTNTIPKIKIKTLKELQDPEVFQSSLSNKQNHTQANEDKNHVSDAIIDQFSDKNKNLKKRNLSEKADINITDLKQGIIEASRTLINTQKRFKELAKVISSNLIYKPDQAIELITQFHDILKTCHTELDLIDSNVKDQFGHFIPSNDIDSIMQLVSPKGFPNNTPMPKKNKRGRPRKKTQPNYEHDIDQNFRGFEEIENHSSTKQIATNEVNVEPSTVVSSYRKSKRGFLVFNPLGKKVILGSPEITEDDLRRIPNTLDSSPSQDTSNKVYKLPSHHNDVYLEELRRRQYLSRKMSWKKKNIWLSSKRKKNKKHSLKRTMNSPLAYNEEGALIKKRRYKRRKKLTVSDNDDDDDDYNDKTYTDYQHYPKRKIRHIVSEQTMPQRLSGRMHPSSVAYLSQLGFPHVMKPCSVVLERLDPRIVEIINKIPVYENNSD